MARNDFIRSAINTCTLGDVGGTLVSSACLKGQNQGMLEQFGNEEQLATAAIQAFLPPEGPS